MGKGLPVKIIRDMYLLAVQSYAIHALASWLCLVNKLALEYIYDMMYVQTSLTVPSIVVYVKYQP